MINFGLIIFYNFPEGLNVPSKTVKIQPVDGVKRWKGGDFPCVYKFLVFQEETLKPVAIHVFQMVVLFSNRLFTS